MSAPYRFDHVHIFTRDPLAMALWFRRMFDATAWRRIQSDGMPRIDVELHGLTIYVAQLPADSPQEPRDFVGPIPGLEHIGLRVEDLDGCVADLRTRGAEILIEPRTIRPGVRYAFVRGPENIRIELLERGPHDLTGEALEISAD